MSTDYIIVGAGSAGCVLANRLSADPRNQVLLIEAGSLDSHPYVTMPKGVGKLFGKPQHMWYFKTEAQPELGVPSEIWFRGKMLGGSSSVNGMNYYRGHREDYEEWVRRGATGWGWDTVKRCFTEIENLNGTGKGPLGISITRRETEINRAFIDAGTQMGIPEVADLNHDEQYGVGYVSANTLKGRRSSSSQAFLRPAMKRKNLRVETGVLIDHVIFDGKRAIGVVGTKDDQPVEYRAEREVILSAGGLVSPQILQRSGVGPARHLTSLGIPVVLDSPRIGEDMLEHRALMMRYRLTKEISDNREYSGLRLVGHVLRYYLDRGGLMSYVPHECASYAKTDPSLDQPDVQITMAGTSAGLQPNGKVAIDSFPGMNIFGYPLRSLSKGSVMIASKDPAAAAIIKPNYLTHEYDRKVTVDMVRLMRKWVEMPAIAPLIAEEHFPGLSKVQTDDEIIDVVRSQGHVCYHACGTVAMGGEDAPLDEKLRVRGLSGLRVVDGSSMPMMPSCNTNGPIMAMGWRAAELILEGRNN